MKKGREAIPANGGPSGIFDKVPAMKPHFKAATLWLLVACGALAQQHAPFSHKQHAVLKLACSTCHTTAEKADAASFPASAQCRVCHTEMADRKIPSKRIYRLPDFAIFSHFKHTAAKPQCTQCHGDVTATNQIVLAQPLKMAFCVDCHKANKAVLTCNACHELGQ